MLSPLLFASDSRGRLFTVDVPTGAIDVRGTMARTMLDIAFDPNGSLYGVDARSTLFKIDPNTAATTRIGRVGAFVNALVFAPDGTLYGAGLQLFQIDPATGARTQIGSFQGLRSSGDLALGFVRWTLRGMVHGGVVPGVTPGGLRLPERDAAFRHRSFPEAGEGQWLNRSLSRQGLQGIRLSRIPRKPWSREPILLIRRRGHSQG